MSTSSLSRLISLCTSLTICSGCVSVSLSPKISKANNVEFKAPSQPFESIYPPGADKAWQDKNLGNSISFMSTCNDPSDPSIEIVEKDMLNNLQAVKIKETKNDFFNGRESRRSQAEGDVDGIPTKVEVLTFKKNSCTYSLMYVAIAKHFEQDLSAFQNFLASFKAP